MRKLSTFLLPAAAAAALIGSLAAVAGPAAADPWDHHGYGYGSSYGYGYGRGDHDGWRYRHGDYGYGYSWRARAYDHERFEHRWRDGWRGDYGHRWGGDYERRW
jgi:hypothetical protein